MLAESRRYMDRAPMLVVAPGIAIFGTALAVTALGQSLDASTQENGRGRRRRRWRRRSSREAG